MRRSWKALVASLLACACSSSTSEPATSDEGAQGTPAAVHFSGTYEVPTPPNLSAAARYAVEGITWSVEGQSAALDYDLPKELVGSALRVSFAGSLDTAGSAQLMGEAGTADCTVSAAEVVCHEVMRGLLPLEPDIDVVERLAAKTYAGAAQDRIDVARLFSTDPIGIVTIDLSSGKADDDAIP
jgi:hypothetical protein